MIGSCRQTGGLVRVKAHTRRDPKHYGKRKYMSKLRSVISTGRSKLGKRRRLRAVGSGFNVY
jgi:hypothetical protein